MEHDISFRTTELQMITSAVNLYKKSRKKQSDKRLADRVLNKIRSTIKNDLPKNGKSVQQDDFPETLWWRLFSVMLPQDGETVWVTNGSSVWEDVFSEKDRCSLRYGGSVRDEYMWMPII